MLFLHLFIVMQLLHSVCVVSHTLSYLGIFSFLHKPSDFLHWLCLAQQIYAILSWIHLSFFTRFIDVNFLIQKFCPCKKNDKYEVWFSRVYCLNLILIMFVHPISWSALLESNYIGHFELIFFLKMLCSIRNKMITTTTSDQMMVT